MIKKLSSRTVYQNKWMTVREDDVEFPGGAKGIYGVVDKPDFALIVPFTGDGFYLVKQYRYPVGASFWEFPQGSAETNPGIDPTELARQELAEETGLKARDVKRIGYQYAAYGFASQGFYIFLAQDFEQGEQRLETGEAGMEVGQFSIADFEKMIDKGEIRDAPTISAYGLLKMKKVI